MNNPFSLENKTILVTGASSGIGRSSAIALSQAGAKVILVARSEEKLAETFEKLSGEGHVCMPFDLTMLEEIPLWMKNMTDRMGALSGLLHCAGIQITKPLQFSNVIDIEKIWKINVASAFMLAKGFRQKKVRALDASIVLMSSVVAEYGSPGVSAYAASKGAIQALIKSLSMELLSEGIRVNGIAPGIVKTEMAEESFSKLTDAQVDALGKMYPLGFGLPEDVAYAVVYLMSRAARWVTGEIMHVDGGYHAR
ncbi:MAG: SDR family NAD(P)-dependent oxidoreductase [Gammaproteobacteria bacterium]|nr:SDR family NAD(P)-dependent oxidoreductase [Gammaproteobacteria bacterium]